MSESASQAVANLKVGESFHWSDLPGVVYTKTSATEVTTTDIGDEDTIQTVGNVTPVATLETVALFSDIGLLPFTFVKHDK